MDAARVKQAMKQGAPPPRFASREMVTHGRNIRMQVLKIRHTAEDGYLYKIRYYNALVGAYWVPEADLYPNMV